MSPKTTSVLRLKKKQLSHLWIQGKDECSVEGAFPSENPRFGFLNHMIHSSFLYLIGRWFSFIQGRCEENFFLSYQRRVCTFTFNALSHNIFSYFLLVCNKSWQREIKKTLCLWGTLFFHSLIFPAKGSNRFQTLQFVKHYTQQCSHGNFLKTLV